MKKKAFIIGIDVSKDKLDVYFYETNLHFIISNDFKGFAELTEMIIRNSKCNKKHYLSLINP